MLLPDALGAVPMNRKQWVLRTASRRHGRGLRQISVWGEQALPEQIERDIERRKQEEELIRQRDLAILAARKAAEKGIPEGPMLAEKAKALVDAVAAAGRGLPDNTGGKGKGKGKAATATTAATTAGGPGGVAPASTTSPGSPRTVPNAITNGAAPEATTVPQGTIGSPSRAWQEGSGQATGAYSDAVVPTTPTAGQPLRPRTGPPPAQPAWGAGSLAPQAQTVGQHLQTGYLQPKTQLGYLQQPQQQQLQGPPEFLQLQPQQQKQRQQQQQQQQEELLRQQQEHQQQQQPAVPPKPPNLSGEDYSFLAATHDETENGPSDVLPPKWMRGATTAPAPQYEKLATLRPQTLGREAKHRQQQQQLQSKDAVTFSDA